jgi:hypothetical protein
MIFWLVMDRGDGLVAVEAKSGETVATDFFPPLAQRIDNM